VPNFSLKAGRSARLTPNKTPSPEGCGPTRQLLKRKEQVIGTYTLKLFKSRLSTIIRVGDGSLSFDAGDDVAAVRHATTELTDALARSDIVELWSDDDRLVWEKTPRAGWREVWRPGDPMDAPRVKAGYHSNDDPLAGIPPEHLDFADCRPPRVYTDEESAKLRRMMPEHLRKLPRYLPHERWRKQMLREREEQQKREREAEISARLARTPDPKKPANE
jgi:hypothetical protein